MEPEIKKTIQVNLITLEKLGKLWISLEVYLITDPELVVFISRKMELKLIVPMVLIRIKTDQIIDLIGFKFLIDSVSVQLKLWPRVKKLLDPLPKWPLIKPHLKDFAGFSKALFYNRFFI